MIETVASQTGEIVSLDEAKQELGVWDSADDASVRLKLQAARAHCEGWGEITLQLSATRTIKCSEWPRGGWVLKHPPVASVTSITYYDADNASQTFSSDNYRTHLTAAGFGLIEFIDNVNFPALYSRDDAVTVTYVTGWQDADDAPADAKAAIILMMKAIDGNDDARNLAYSEKVAKQLLAGVSAWSYA